VEKQKPTVPGLLRAKRSVGVYLNAPSCDKNARDSVVTTTFIRLELISVYHRFLQM